VTGFEIRDLDAQTWPCFEVLVARHNGLAMFEVAGFARHRQIGKPAGVMRRVLSRAGPPVATG
jgi:hypothetical protein